jgi:hypothetical protein
MSTNKITKGVFTDIIGSDTEIPSYDVFINYNGVKSKTLNKFSKEYNKLITQHKSTINRMAKLEELILQLRAVESDLDIKLSMVRDEYIYARTPFFRIGKTTKDIRIIVDRCEFWSTDLESLLLNEEFMIKAKTKLIKAMNEEIKLNISEFETTK